MHLPDLIKGIEPIDEDMIKKAKEHTARLCMPPRALGKLHNIAERLCGLRRTLNPSVEKKGFLVMAGDHGMVKNGVSAFPQEVTGEMVKNFIRGGAGINALARQLEAKVVVVDMGIIPDLADTLPGENPLIKKKIGPGTNDFTKGTAMSRNQAEQAIMTGFELAGSLFQQGIDILGTGEMGIGNTTSASAITVAITGRPVEEVTGYGTGVTGETFRKKCSVIQQGLVINQPDPTDGLDVLAKVGGFEIGGMAGLILAAAYYQKPVVLDGFIAGAGALIAYTLCPLIAQYALAGHCSVEQGHKYILAHLGLEPILNLDLRLGEGTGAALAMHLIEAACRIFHEVLTFDQAEVSGKIQ